jgi:hypothetical protein
MKRTRKEDVILIHSDSEDSNDVLEVKPSLARQAIAIGSDDEKPAQTKRPRKKRKAEQKHVEILPTKVVSIDDEIDAILNDTPTAKVSSACASTSKLTCRFCKAHVTLRKRKSKNMPDDVCNKDECWDLFRKFCSKLRSCGHHCLGTNLYNNLTFLGVKNESSCMDCIHPKCAGTEQQTSEDPCNICYDNLESEPCIKLNSCGHIFHFNCLETWVQQGYDEPQIGFNNLNCKINYSYR